MAKLAGADLCKDIFSDLDMLRATWVDSVMRVEGKSLTAGCVCVDVARLIGGEEVMGGLLVSMADLLAVFAEAPLASQTSGTFGCRFRQVQEFVTDVSTWK